LESITYEPQNIVTIVDSAYPDIRKIINTAQMNSSKGTLKLDKTNIIDSDIRTKIVEILQSKDDKRNKYMNSRKAIADSRMQDFTELYTYLYEKVDDYADGNTSSVILLLAEGQYKDAMVVDREIVFMATLVNIIGVVS